MPDPWTLDPQETLDFAFDFKAKTHYDADPTAWPAGVPIPTSDYLATGETITSHTITAATGVTVSSSSEADGKVTVWLTAGLSDAQVTCHIQTSAGRIAERSRLVRVHSK